MLVLKRVGVCAKRLAAAGIPLAFVKVVLMKFKLNERKSK
jgi:hypothetical protein